MELIKSINPFNNSVLAEFEEYSQAKVDQILSNARGQFDLWKKSPFTERSKLMKNCGDHLLRNKRDLAELICKEMGKPILQAIAEIEKCAAACDYYAKHSEQFLKDEKLQSDGQDSFICYQPLGTILAIMPWNFPFWQVFRFAAPALMAGNVAILKHSSNVPQCSLAIEKIFRAAGFPEHVFQTVIISSSKVNYLIEHPTIAAVTLTGSERAGGEVASVAGKNIKKTVLELGGSDAFIVLADADMDYAAEIAVKSRMINAGQSCIAAKRFIVVKEIYEEFLQKMKSHMERLVIGDPLEEQTDLGPLAREDLAVSLQQQVDNSLSKGAKKYWGGGRPAIKGAFFNPTIMTDIHPGMPAYEEEFFGPVALMFKAKDPSDAIRIANDSRYGLGGSIWTKDLTKAVELAREIESGAVFINGMVKSDPRLPFGGIKKSGYGRELSYLGIREFVNIKTVWVK